MLQAQVDTSEGFARPGDTNHQAGTAPVLDELRARVDYQTQQQTSSRAESVRKRQDCPGARHRYAARTEVRAQPTRLPMRPLDEWDRIQLCNRRLRNPQGPEGLEEQVKSAHKARSAATAERYPTISFHRRLWRHRHQFREFTRHLRRNGLATVPVLEEEAARRCPPGAGAARKPTGAIQRYPRADRR